MTDLDVAVIGAGISGLAVADALSRDGRRVRVFEARDRVGGRLLSMPMAGGSADLGATWFWPGEARVAALIEDLALPVHDHFIDGAAIMVAQETMRRVSVEMPQSYRFSNGADSLTNALAARLPEGVVALSAEVQRIERSQDHVLLRVGGDQISAEVAVVAVPPRLAVERGVVVPTDLPSEVAHVAGAVAVWMGMTVKVVAQFANPFWREMGLSGTISAWDGPFREIHDMSGVDGSPAMLFGFGDGSSDRSDTDYAEMFAQQLTGIFGPDGRPEKTQVTNWAVQPFTTPTARPASERYDLFGHAALRQGCWDDRLFWSSTETGVTAPGHIEGALDAAQRTVQAIQARY